MLYGEVPEINAIVDDIEDENESDLFQAEWCQFGQDERIAALEIDEKREVASVEFEKKLRSEFVSAIEASKMKSEELDARPYLHDSLTDRHLLLDSGSQVTAYPPDPGDKPDPNMKLRAVNGTRLNCYG